jgi:hypothetical protein
MWVYVFNNELEISAIFHVKLRCMSERSALLVLFASYYSKPIVTQVSLPFSFYWVGINCARSGCGLSERALHATEKAKHL